MSPATHPSTSMLKALANQPFIYGTAWKKDATTALVHEALSAGFVAIDTAAQPKHYQEDLVGAGVRAALRAGTMRRDQLYLQTKYTPPGSQDPARMPYAASAPLETQVRDSVASSLRNLRASDDDASGEGEGEAAYIDCVLLHTPLPTIRGTVDAWKVLESFVPARVRALGISNVALPELEILHRVARVKPAVVQNRFHARSGWDGALRAFCREQGIVYQSFWTLTGNPELLAASPVTMLAGFAGVSVQVALYALVRALGVVVLNGTTRGERMREDLEGLEKVERWAAEKEDSWNTLFGDFKHLIGDEDVE